MKAVVCCAVLALACAPFAAVASDTAIDRDPPEKMPSAMTNKEIAAYNEGLDVNHPYYIRCRKIEETGSLVKKARVCKTNDGWKQAFAVGNQNARETAETMITKAITGN